jgi:mRNA interferase RelE/StbE
MRRLDAGATRRVDAAIRALADDPRPPGCLKLSGPSGLWRIRAGDWRVIYAIDDAARTVTVTTVAHRRESYRGL